MIWHFQYTITLYNFNRKKSFNQKGSHSVGEYQSPWKTIWFTSVFKFTVSVELLRVKNISGDWDTIILLDEFIILICCIWNPSPFIQVDIIENWGYVTGNLGTKRSEKSWVIPSTRAADRRRKPPFGNGARITQKERKPRRILIIRSGFQDPP